jgi:CO dehydrogenase nickel-insertion accessory protein CooC1
MAAFPFLGFVPYDPRIVEADLAGKPSYEENPEFLQAMRGIVEQMRRSDA